MTRFVDVLLQDPEETVDFAGAAGSAGTSARCTLAEPSPRLYFGIPGAGQRGFATIYIRQWDIPFPPELKLPVGPIGSALGAYFFRVDTIELERFTRQARVEG